MFMIETYQRYYERYKMKSSTSGRVKLIFENTLLSNMALMEDVHYYPHRATEDNAEAFTFGELTTWIPTQSGTSQSKYFIIKAIRIFLEHFDDGYFVTKIIFNLRNFRMYDLTSKTQTSYELTPQQNEAVRNYVFRQFKKGLLAARLPRRIDNVLAYVQEEVLKPSPQADVSKAADPQSEQIPDEWKWLNKLDANDTPPEKTDAPAAAPDKVADIEMSSGPAISDMTDNTVAIAGDNDATASVADAGDGDAYFNPGSDDEHAFISDDDPMVDPHDDVYDPHAEYAFAGDDGAGNTRADVNTPDDFGYGSDDIKLPDDTEQEDGSGSINLSYLDDVEPITGDNNVESGTSYNSDDTESPTDDSADWSQSSAPEPDHQNDDYMPPEQDNATSSLKDKVDQAVSSLDTQPPEDGDFFNDYTAPTPADTRQNDFFNDDDFFDDPTMPNATAEPTSIDNTVEPEGGFFNNYTTPTPASASAPVDSITKPNLPTALDQEDGSRKTVWEANDEAKDLFRGKKDNYTNLDKMANNIKAKAQIVPIDKKILQTFINISNTVKPTKNPNVFKAEWDDFYGYKKTQDNINKMNDYIKQHFRTANNVIKLDKDSNAITLNVPYEML